MTNTHIRRYDVQHQAQKNDTNRYVHDFHGEQVFAQLLLKATEKDMYPAELWEDLVGAQGGPLGAVAWLNAAIPNVKLI